MAVRVEFTANQMRSMTSRYRKGESAESLAQHFGVSTSTILRTLRNANVEIRPRGRPAVEA